VGIAIDTSALVELERRGQELIDQIPEEAGEVFIPALVLAELRIGVELADSAERRAARTRRIEALLRGTRSLAFDERIAPTYARIYAELTRAGTSIPSNDLAIAASAVHFGHELLVGAADEEHFRRVQGLVVRVLGECDT
jgi:tRNA(fMet)-specific endonuclease VapC